MFPIEISENETYMTYIYMTYTPEKWYLTTSEWCQVVSTMGPISRTADDEPWESVQEGWVNATSSQWVVTVSLSRGISEKLGGL